MQNIFDNKNPSLCQPVPWSVELISPLTDKLGYSITNCQEIISKHLNILRWLLEIFAWATCPTIISQYFWVYCCCCCFCGAYWSSCHWTASYVNYWTIRTLFIAITTSCFEESAQTYEFPMIRSFCGFLPSSIPLEYAVCSKPSRSLEVIIVKRLIQQRNNLTRVRVWTNIM